MGKIKYDLARKTFGRLKVIRRDGSKWICECSCGNTISVVSSGLIRGKYLSCGCFRKEYITNRNKKPKGYSTRRLLYNRYKRNSLSKNLEFSLTFLEFSNLVLGKCYYCGREPFRLAHTLTDSILVSGVDRINSDKGYTLNNCVSCCNQCNVAKKAYSREDFLKWIKLIYENLYLHKE